MGVRDGFHDGTGFSADGGLTILSEVSVPGDIQRSRDGAPFVLMGECQTTGGTRRIGDRRIPATLPAVAQAASGPRFQFRVHQPRRCTITLEDAGTVATSRRLAGQITPADPRLPRQNPQPAAYQLVGGCDLCHGQTPFEEEH